MRDGRSPCRVLRCRPLCQRTGQHILIHLYYTLPARAVRVPQPMSRDSALLARAPVGSTDHSAALRASELCTERSQWHSGFRFRFAVPCSALPLVPNTSSPTLSHCAHVVYLDSCTVACTRSHCQRTLTRSAAWRQGEHLFNIPAACSQRRAARAHKRFLPYPISCLSDTRRSRVFMGAGPLVRASPRPHLLAVAWPGQPLAAASPYRERIQCQVRPCRASENDSRPCVRPLAAPHPSSS